MREARLGTMEGLSGTGQYHRKRDDVHKMAQANRHSPFPLVVSSFKFSARKTRGVFHPWTRTLKPTFRGDVAEINPTLNSPIASIPWSGRETLASLRTSTPARPRRPRARILFHTGLIHKIGDVDDGNTVTDWMEQERERGITITSAAVTCFWTQKKEEVVQIPRNHSAPDQHHRHPGHVDFTAEVERSMRVLDGAVYGVLRSRRRSTAVRDGLAPGHQIQGSPYCAFVNKMDRTGANFQNALNDMRKKLNAYASPDHAADRAEDRFEGVIDVVNQKAIVWGPGDILNEGLKYEIREIPEAMRAGRRKTPKSDRSGFQQG